MKILFISKSPDATEYFRCQVPAKFLAMAGHEVRTDYIDPFPRIPGSGIKEVDCEWADVIVFQRPITNTHYKIIEMIKKVVPHKVLVGEYDDDYGSVPNWNPGYGYIKAHDGEWQNIYKLYDGVITSTAPLAEAARKRIQPNVPVQVIPNGFDLELMDSIEPTTDLGMFAPTLGGANKDMCLPLYNLTNDGFNEMMKDKTVVYWAGSKFHFVDLDWIAEDLKTVAEKDDSVVFLFVGYITGRIVEKLPVNRLFVAQGGSPVSKYYQILKSLKKDIGLCPVDPCEFNESKSALKVYESMYCGAYPLASDFDTYENDIGRGRLVDYGEGDWAEAILDTVADHRNGLLKEKIDFNTAYMRENFDARTRTQMYVNFFEQLLEKKRGVSGT